MQIQISAKFWLCLHVWCGDDTGWRCHMLHPFDDYAAALLRLRQYHREMDEASCYATKYFIGNDEGLPIQDADLSK